MEWQRVRHHWETFMFPKVLLSVKLIFALCAYFRLSAYNAFHHYCLFLLPGLPQGLSGKESACQCRKLTGDTGSIPGLGRSPGEGNGTHSSYLAWEVAWTEEPGGLQFIGLQIVGAWTTKQQQLPSSELSISLTMGKILLVGKSLPSKWYLEVFSSSR